MVKEGFTYSDILKMPTYERKYFIGKIIERLDLIEESRQKQ